MDKKIALRNLAIKRKLITPPQGSYQIGHFHNGLFDCEHVSPYSKGAHNPNAALFILLQDWASYFDMTKRKVKAVDIQLGYDPDQPTNKHLSDLLFSNFTCGISDVYGTNIYPFIKEKRPITIDELTWAAKEFAVPEILIVKPKLVICLGLDTFNALRKARDVPQVDNVTDGLCSPFEIENISVWLQAHTGNLGRYNRTKKNKNQVEEDWNKMAEFIKNKWSCINLCDPSS
jgi:restriction system protein